MEELYDHLRGHVAALQQTSGAEVKGVLPPSKESILPPRDHYDPKKVVAVPTAGGGG
jgi:hypothetical protein